MKPYAMNRKGFLCLYGWAGRSEQPVTIIGETPKRYRVRNDQPDRIRLAGYCRWLAPGAVVLVPKGAVRAADKGEHAP